MGVREKAKAGIAWNVIADVGIQVLRFGGSIILARILFPQDFGLMGIAAIFINFAKRLANFGFSASLVQKKEIDRGHVDSMFWFNFAIYSVITIGVVVTAPYVQAFFESPMLESILPVVALAFFIEAMSGVPDALLKKRLQFKQLAFSRLLRNIINITIAVIFAILGFGVWSLVWGMLIGNAIRLILLFAYARWLPGLRFSIAKLKDLAKFGLGVTLANYLNYFIKNTDYFIIGKFLGTDQLGYYERAFNLMNMTRRRVARNMNAVLFAAYSKIQDQDEKIRAGVHKVLQSVGVISYPIHGLLFFLAPALIYNLYGPKWIPTIQPLQIMCASGLINSMVVIFNPVVMAKKRVFRWTMVQSMYWFLLASSIFLSLPYGINGVAIAVVFSSAFYLLAMVFLISRVIPFGFKDFLNNQWDLWLYFVPTFGVTFLSNHLLGQYFDEYSPIKALMLTIIFGSMLVISHLVWRKAFVGEFFIEIAEFFKKGLAKMQGKPNESLAKK
ncbi:MAG: lipopolysaccharide biosynthesis protein [Calditrichaeota bacterium]|nr:lipopolysaccharide biosynthesis protein [Calditrichota bacterium]